MQAQLMECFFYIFEQLPNSFNTTFILYTFVTSSWLLG